MTHKFACFHCLFVFRNIIKDSHLAFEGSGHQGTKEGSLTLRNELCVSVFIYKHSNATWINHIRTAVKPLSCLFC